MEKIKLLMGALVFFAVGSVNANATEQDTREKEAKFRIIENEGGTIIVEAQDLLFGDHTLAAEDINLKTSADSAIDITEFSGSRPGWTLKVQLDKFKDGANEAHGTRLFYPKVTPTTTTLDAEMKAPTSVETDKSFTDDLKGRIVNDDNLPIKIAGAQAGNGYGKWQLPYKGANKIQLNIPMGQKVGAYTAKLTYTIEDAPTP